MINRFKFDQKLFHVFAQTSVNVSSLETLKGKHDPLPVTKTRET